MTAALTWQRRLFASGALVCIAGVLLNLTPPAPLQVFLLVVLVVLIGLPHGALDPVVAWRAHLWRTPVGLIAFLVAYVALAGLALGLWRVWPGIALGTFLAYSAWHFSADWQGVLAKPLALSGGLLIIAGPSLFHSVETSELFAMLSSESTAQTVTAFLQWIARAALIGTGLAVAVCIKRDRATAIELVLLAGAVAYLPPLMFFLVYFCGLHSPRHLLHAVEGLKPRLALVVGTLFTLIALLGGLLALKFMPPVSGTRKSVQLVFIGLAVLTVPHMLLIEMAATRHWKFSPEKK